MGPMPSPPLFPFYSPIKRLTNTNVKVYIVERDLPWILRIRSRTVKIKATGLTFTFRFLIITNKEDDILIIIIIVILLQSFIIGFTFHYCFTYFTMYRNPQCARKRTNKNKTQLKDKTKKKRVPRWFSVSLSNGRSRAQTIGAMEDRVQRRLSLCPTRPSSLYT